MRIRIYFFFTVVALLICVWTQAQGQNSPAVQNLRLTTADGIEFKVWAAPSINQKDIVIHYLVTNQGPKPIYLVNKLKPKISLIEGNFTVLIEAPYPTYPKYEPFDYSFLLVNRGGSRRGTFAIPRTMMSQGPLPVRIAFGYVTNKYGLDVANPDPVLGELLRSRIYVVVLGDLVTEQF